MEELFVFGDDFRVDPGPLGAHGPDQRDHVTAHGES
jgi:hypothetical protein